MNDIQRLKELLQNLLEAPKPAKIDPRISLAGNIVTLTIWLV